MRLWLILFLLVSMPVFASQGVGHVRMSALVWENSPEVVDILGFEVDVRPLLIVGGHVAQDRLIGESGLGEYQWDMNITRGLIMFFTVPEDKQMNFLWYSFWGLLPDLIDQGLGTRYFHPEIDPVFELDRLQTNLLEELFLLNFVVTFN